MNSTTTNSTTTTTFWQPRKKGKFLAVLFLSDGVTPSGIAVMHHEKKLKSLAVAIETSFTNTVQPGDVVLYKEGFAEDLTTSEGDVFCLIDETSVISILDNMFLHDDQIVTESRPW